jgi:hypothetical protein
MRSQAAEIEVAHRWIDLAPAGTRWLPIVINVTGQDAATMVYRARCSLRNSIDTQRCQSRAWRAVEVRGWVADVVRLSDRVCGRLQSILAAMSPDVDSPAVRDALGRCRAWREPGAIKVQDAVPPERARDLIVLMIDAWSALEAVWAGSRRIRIGPGTASLTASRCEVLDVRRTSRDPMPWLF